MDRRYSFLSFPERLDRWQRLLPYALLLTVTFALYATTLYFGFLWDDDVYIRKNYHIQGLSPLHFQAIWSTFYLGHYAPVQHTFLAILYHFSGMDSFGYHLGQLLVHAACVCLLYFLLKKLEAPRVALLASLLFAVHPTNIETVAWIAESKSTLAFLFFLLSFWAFLRLRERERWWDGVLCGLFLVLSLLSKINTVVAPAIFLLYDYKRGDSPKQLRWRSLAPFFLISGFFTGVHLLAFFGTPQGLENEYFGGPGVHLMNLPLLLAFYLQMIVFPHPLSAWQMFPAQSEFNWLIALGWLGLLAMAWLVACSRRHVQFWTLWMIVFLLPVLQIVPFPIWVAERYLYIPAVGGFVLLSRMFFHAAERRRAWSRWGLEGGLLAALLVLAWRTHKHLPIWANDLSLWTATTPTCMTSAYCHMQLGLSLLGSGQNERGMREMIRAAEIRQDPRVLERLGDAYTLAAKDYRQAIIAYTLAAQKQQLGPFSQIYGKVARAHYLSGNLAQARQAIENGKRISPNDPGLWIAAGFLQWKQENWEEARRSLRRALAMTGRRSNIAPFFTEFWGEPAEVGRMLSDLRSAQNGAQK